MKPWSRLSDSGQLRSFLDRNAFVLTGDLDSHRTWAVSTCDAITAWEGLVDRARVDSGHKVLIHAGAGGVGYIAIQLGKSFGADVFATVSAGKQGIIEELGAIPINYRALSVEQYVDLHTQGQGFDIVYDSRRSDPRCTLHRSQAVHRPCR